MLRKPLTVDYERFVPVGALVILALSVGQALFQSLSAWLSGAKLQYIFLTTFRMTLLRLWVGTTWIERTPGRKDLVGAGGGTLHGMFTPVCSCTVTNLYAGIVAGGPAGAHRRCFTSPARPCRQSRLWASACELAG
ncbi:MAG: hypothetical protein HXY37_04225 [Chloroflexi bacterium]|nr:hypothetical protein [Chloroflexota bacterium]